MAKPAAVASAMRRNSGLRVVVSIFGGKKPARNPSKVQQVNTALRTILVGLGALVEQRNTVNVKLLDGLNAGVDVLHDTFTERMKKKTRAFKKIKYH